MTRRASKAPDWPERLRLQSAEPVTIIEGVEAPTNPVQWVPGIWKGEAKDPHAPTIALFLGHHKNGYHCAAELQVVGRDVVGGTVLCVSPYAAHAARAWSDCATARLFHRREYTATEAEANAREGRSMALEELAHGEALAIARTPKGTVATRLEVEGRKVLRFEVIAQGDRLNTTAEAFSWAERYLLPREKRR